MLKRGVVSVIVPVYNIEKYIGRCIESILSQTYADLEIILVDDGSTDSSGAICDEYAEKDSRIKVIHQKNGGVSSARNRGLDVATGKYIGFVDGDDYILDSMYEKLVKIIGGEAISACTMGGNSGISVADRSFRRTFSAEDAVACLLQNRYLSISCADKLFRREVVGDIRFRQDIYHNEDLLFLYEVLKRSNVLEYTDDVCYFYRCRPGSAVNSPFDDRKMTLIDAWDYLKTDIEKSFPSLTDIVAEQRIRNNISCALAIAGSNYDKSDAIRRIQRNVRKDIIPFLRSRLASGYKIEALLLSLSWNLFRFVNRKKA